MTISPQIVPFHPEKHVYFPLSWQMCNFAFHLHQIFRNNKIGRGQFN